MKVLVIGAGGHGQVVAEILRAAARGGERIEFGGYIDDRLLQVPVSQVVGTLASLSHVPHDAIVVAVADNQTRARLIQRLDQAGERLALALHPSAIVADDVAAGAGTMICAGAIAAAGARIGRGVILNAGCSVDHHCRIDDYVHVGPGARIGGDVVIGERAFIGMGALVLPQVTIGAGAVIGAGAIVTRDVDAESSLEGTRARSLDRVAQYVTR